MVENIVNIIKEEDIEKFKKNKSDNDKRNQIFLNLKSVKRRRLASPSITNSIKRLPRKYKTNFENVNDVAVKSEFYGHIPGITVGQHWTTRLDCSKAKVHYPIVHTIHGGFDGAYSVILTSDFADLDNGEWLIFSSKYAVLSVSYGFSGKKVRSDKSLHDGTVSSVRFKNQTANVLNISLIKSVETKKPIRLVRGYKCKSQYAPKEGYRYDGLYTVDKFWKCSGPSGYLIYKYKMKRCQDQDPAPWYSDINANTKLVPRSNSFCPSRNSHYNVYQLLNWFTLTKDGNYSSDKENDQRSVEVRCIDRLTSESDILNKNNNKVRKSIETYFTGNDKINTSIIDSSDYSPTETATVGANISTCRESQFSLYQAPNSAASTAVNQLVPLIAQLKSEMIVSDRSQLNDSDVVFVGFPEPDFKGFCGTGLMSAKIFHYAFLLNDLKKNE